MHFDTYCAAWSKTLEDETFVKAEKADIEARIDQTKSDFISARRGKCVDFHIRYGLVLRLLLADASSV